MKLPLVPELLLPAGTLDSLKTAILYGADAVYAGTPALSLRTRSRLSFDGLATGIRFAHERGKKVYLTLNLFAHHRDLERIEESLPILRDLKPDGLIVADPAVFELARQIAPELELHVSTQANVMSWRGVEHWRKQGARRCVLAREISFTELAEIRLRCPNVQLETFVHGSMCVSHSGRCLLSNYLAARGANQGECAHSCRWNYKVRVGEKGAERQPLNISEANLQEFQFYLEEEFRTGQLLPIEQDEQGTFILSSKDLCLMPKLGRLLSLPIDALKVEGRNKNQYYTAVVARAYRQAIDRYAESPEDFDPSPFMAELETTSSRGFTLGFWNGTPGATAQDYESAQSLSEHEFAGVVRRWDDGDLIMELKNRVTVGEELEVLAPRSEKCRSLRLTRLEDALTGEEAQKIPAGESRAIRIRRQELQAAALSIRAEDWPPLSVVRKRAAVDAPSRSRVNSRRRDYAIENGER